MQKLMTLIFAAIFTIAAFAQPTPAPEPIGTSGSGQIAYATPAAQPVVQWGAQRPKALVFSDQVGGIYTVDPLAPGTVNKYYQNPRAGAFVSFLSVGGNILYAADDRGSLFGFTDYNLVGRPDSGVTRRSIPQADFMVLPANKRGWVPFQPTIASASNVFQRLFVYGDQDYNVMGAVSSSDAQVKPYGCAGGIGYSGQTYFCLGIENGVVWAMPTDEAGTPDLSRRRVFYQNSAAKGMFVAEGEGVYLALRSPYGGSSVVRFGFSPFGASVATSVQLVAAGPLLSLPNLGPVPMVVDAGYLYVASNFYGDLRDLTTFQGQAILAFPTDRPDPGNATVVVSPGGRRVIKGIGTLEYVPTPITPQPIQQQRP